MRKILKQTELLLNIFVQRVFTNIMTKKEVDKILQELSWTFAKTYTNAPHHYTTITDISTNEHRKKWLKVVRFIWENSKKEHWKCGKYYFYYKANGYKYWVMDKTAETTDLINRAKDEYNNKPPIND